MVMGDRGVELFVIYERPRDYPYSYVLRRQVVDGQGEIHLDPVPLAVALVVDEVRAKLPPFLTRLQGPGTDPDPVIYEVWI
jgi:hypothetical protein